MQRLPESMAIRDWINFLTLLRPNFTVTYFFWMIGTLFDCFHFPLILRILTSPSNLAALCQTRLNNLLAAVYGLPLQSLISLCDFSLFRNMFLLSLCFFSRRLPIRLAVSIEPVWFLRFKAIVYLVFIYGLTAQTTFILHFPINKLIIISQKEID